MNGLSKDQFMKVLHTQRCWDVYLENKDFSRSRVTGIRNQQNSTVLSPVLLDLTWLQEHRLNGPLCRKLSSATRFLALVAV